MSLWIYASKSQDYLVYVMTRERVDGIWNMVCVSHHLVLVRRHFLLPPKGGSSSVNYQYGHST